MCTLSKYTSDILSSSGKPLQRWSRCTRQGEAGDGDAAACWWRRDCSTPRSSGWWTMNRRQAERLWPSRNALSLRRVGTSCQAWRPPRHLLAQGSTDHPSPPRHQSDNDDQEAAQLEWPLGSLECICPWTANGDKSLDSVMAGSGCLTSLSERLGVEGVEDGEATLSRATRGAVTLSPSSPPLPHPTFFYFLVYFLYFCITSLVSSSLPQRSGRTSVRTAGPHSLTISMNRVVSSYHAAILLLLFIRF